MDFSAEKLDLITWIAELKDISIIKRIQALRNHSTTPDWAATLSKEEKESISNGLADFENGKIVEHTEVQKRYAKWL